jgi:hypothetical protein
MDLTSGDSDCIWQVLLEHPGFNIGCPAALKCFASPPFPVGSLDIG